jgi:CHASE2 domain-containing sensor protein
MSAVLVALFGLILGFTKVGEGWVNRSYDYLYRFTSRSVTNQVVLVLMDNEAIYSLTNQTRQKWDRALHANLLNRLADDGCPLVVFDVLFRQPREPDTDLALANAMRHLSNLVLMAKQTDAEHQPDAAGAGTVSAHPIEPLPLFLAAAKTNWGVAWIDADSDQIVRRHWPFPSPDSIYPSLAWVAAGLAGAKLDDEPRKRWLRYYPPKTWTSLSYHLAPTQRTNYFHDKIVFIGNKPETPFPNGEEDEFKTPHTRWTGQSSGGVELLATEFLNLVNREWLERADAGVEAFVLILVGLALGASLCHRGMWTLSLGTLSAIVITWIAGVYLTHFTKYWFPWLVVAGGQVPLAFLVGIVWRKRPTTVPMSTIVIHAPTPASRAPAAGTDGPFNPPDYELVEPPFGKGAYGKVWLARNAVGQWQALKAIYRSKFGEDTSPYEREFRGIEHYKRVSDKHPGLLRIDFVSRMKPEGFFYYAMELGDAATPGWEQAPAVYKPLDLGALCATFQGGRVPVRDCIRLATKLCEPLHFLHSQGLTHRDIKPRNIIFVNGEPKLADVGLVTDAHRPPQEVTWVGTPGYMPPEPEPPGTPQADIFGLGMVLYVISTGDKPKAFPEVSTTLVDQNRNPDFNLLSSIIFKACQPDREMRFRTAEEMRTALLEAAAKLSM